VRFVDGYERTDTDIAQAVVTALKWNCGVPAEQVTAAVTNGWITQVALAPAHTSRRPDWARPSRT
jgi:hypothetical protein